MIPPWNLRKFPGWRNTTNHLGDHPRTCKCLGSPPFISHQVRPFGRGPTTRSLGDENDHHGYEPRAHPPTRFHVNHFEQQMLGSVAGSLFLRRPWYRWLRMWQNAWAISRFDVGLLFILDLCFGVIFVNGISPWVFITMKIYLGGGFISFLFSSLPG